MREDVARAIRSLLVEYANSMKEKEGVTNAELVKVGIGFPYYKQNKQHNLGDIVRDPKSERLFKNRQGYDGSVQVDWTLSDRTLWIPFHGITPETAYPYEDPIGAVDMYQVGEYATYNDHIYKAVKPTAYNPDIWPEGWELIEN